LSTVIKQSSPKAKLPGSSVKSLLAKNLRDKILDVV